MRRFRVIRMGMLAALGALGAVGQGCSCDEALTTITGEVETLAVVDFGEVRLFHEATRDISLANVGAGPARILELTIDGDPGFGHGEAPDLIKIQDDAPLRLSFNPEEVGAHEATLTIATDSDSKPNVQVLLQGVGVTLGPQLCTLPPAELDFGTVTIGATADLTSTFENCGDSPLTLTDVTIGGEEPDKFSVVTAPDDGTVLQPGATGAVTVRYAPLDDSSDRARLQLHSDDRLADVREVALLGNGARPPSCELAALPANLDFGPRTMGDTTQLPLNLINVGDLDCVLAGVEVTGATDFGIGAGTVPPEVTLVPDDLHPVWVTYTPSDAGGDSGSIVVHSNDPVTPILTVPLTGSAYDADACLITVTPGSLDFGTATAGNDVVRTVTITSLNGPGDPFGGDQCQVQSATITAGGEDYTVEAIPPFGGLLIADLNLDVTLHADDEGTQLGTLTILTTDAYVPTKLVSLHADVVGARLCWEPAELDYGDVAVGDESALSVTVRNCGEGTLELRSVTLAPGTAEAYTITDMLTLPAGLTGALPVPIEVTYAPTHTLGDFGNLSIISNDPTNPEVLVPLRGNYSGPCDSILRCAPPAVVFADVVVGEPQILSVVCTNFGTEPISVSEVGFSPSTSAAFTIVGAGAAVLGPGENLVVQVRYDPPAEAGHAGIMVIDSDACDAPSLTVQLSGNGIPPNYPECLPPSTFLPTLEWRWTGSPVEPNATSVWMTPAVANLTDDNHDGHIDTNDIPDVIFTSFDDGLFAGFDAIPAVLRAVSGDDGHEIFSIKDARYRFESEGNIAVADIDADGKVEIVGVRYTATPPLDTSDPIGGAFGRYSTGALLCFENDGSFKWESDEWHLPQTTIENGGAPAIADLNRDGFGEIVFGNAVFDHNGRLLWEGSLGEGDAGHGPHAVIADLDMDGVQEVVCGNTAYRADGSVYWHNDDIPDGFPSIANFDADDLPEILLSIGDLYILDSDGSVRRGPVAVDSGGGEGEEGYIPSLPSIADFDGDGEPEVALATKYWIYLFETDLSVKWQAEITDNTGASGPSAFDFEGDGAFDVIHNDEVHVTIFRGTNGEQMFQADRYSRTIFENAVIVDVDNDGHADIVVAENTALGTPGIRVYRNDADNWVGTGHIWNQHSFHVTNVSDAGILPMSEEPSWIVHNTYRANLPRCE